MDFFPDTCFPIRPKKMARTVLWLKKLQTSERSLCFKYSIKKEKHFIWYSIKFTLNNESKLSISTESPRFKDLVRLRTNLPAGHSMHFLASEEALTNHPSEHGSNLYFPRLWLANPDFLKAGSRSSFIQGDAIEEMSIYSESSCPTPLKWKIRKKKGQVIPI